MRRSLARRTGRIAPLATYVAARRALATDVHAFTPTRFLHHLGLLPAPVPWDAPTAARRPLPPDAWRLDESASLEPEPHEAEAQHAQDAPQPLVESADKLPADPVVAASLGLPPVEALVPLVARPAPLRPPVVPALPIRRRDAVRPSPAPWTAAPATTVLPSRPEGLGRPHEPVTGALASAVDVPEPTYDPPPPVKTIEVQDLSYPRVAAPAPVVPNVEAPAAAAPAVPPASAASFAASKAPSLGSPSVAVPQREVTADTAVAPDTVDAPTSEPRQIAPPLPRRRASVQEVPRTEGRPAPRTRYVDEGPRVSHRPRPYGTPTGDDVSRSDAVLGFRPDDGSDRSPLAWAARLADSLRDPSDSAPGLPPVTPAPPPPVTPPPRADGANAPPVLAPLAARPTAPPADHGRRAATTPAPSGRVVPVSHEARRFLLPLVGVDAADATFVAGPAAEAMTRARHADAVTAGTVVALGAEYAGDATPEGLGLLAHELTHVARRVSPRFVPPIARSMSGRATARMTGAADLADEEGLALRVEGRVRAAATSTARPVAGPEPAAVSAEGSLMAPDVLTPDALTPDVLTLDALAPDALSQPISGADDAVVARPEVAKASKWSGLPAPWEPMPDLTSPSPAPAAVASGAWAAPAPTSPPRDARPLAATPSQADVVPALFDGGAHAEAVLAAEHDRTPEAPASAPAHAKAERGDEKPPDLDRLARQVYSVLKRRLQADAAREWA